MIRHNSHHGTPHSASRNNMATRGKITKACVVSRAKMFVASVLRGSVVLDMLLFFASVLRGSVVPRFCNFIIFHKPLLRPQILQFPAHQAHTTGEQKASGPGNVRGLSPLLQQEETVFSGFLRARGTSIKTGAVDGWTSLARLLPAAVQLEELMSS